MICGGCSKAAAAGGLNHGAQACFYPGSCTCQHGRMIEQDPNNKDVPEYVDALPEAERRAAYEVAGRRAPDLAPVLHPMGTLRVTHFNSTVGTHGYTSRLGRTGANLHPDRCRCQGDDPTPHKHRSVAPYACARCVECKAYTPAIPEASDAP